MARAVLPVRARGGLVPPSSWLLGHQDPCHSLACGFIFQFPPLLSPGPSLCFVPVSVRDLVNTSVIGLRPTLIPYDFILTDYFYEDLFYKINMRGHILTFWVDINFGGDSVQPSVLPDFSFRPRVIIHMVTPPLTPCISRCLQGRQCRGLGGFVQASSPLGWGVRMGRYPEDPNRSVLPSPGCATGYSWQLLKVQSFVYVIHLDVENKVSFRIS